MRLRLFTWLVLAFSAAALYPAPAGAVVVIGGSNATISGDFDGDGNADIAIGVPFEDVGGANDAGAVNVIYGSNTGLDAAGNQFWHQDRADVEDTAEAGDNFGWSLAAGDIDNDGFDDLVIGVPGEDVGAINSAGAINIIFGSNDGLDPAGNEADEFWHQDSSSIEGGSEEGDEFGAAVAVGDFDFDERADVAVGVPEEDIGSTSDAGAVNAIYGTTGGLSGTGDQLFFQGQDGIAGASEANDFYGSSLAAGDVNGDQRTDLAVGVPGEDEGSHQDSGGVSLLFGSDPNGLDPFADEFWSQDSAGVLDSAEERDEFGSAVAIGDFNSDGEEDLAVGVPLENFGGEADSGIVNVLFGTAEGLTSEGDQRISQNKTQGTASGDGSEAGDRFGAALAAADFDGDDAEDLAVGVPREDLAGNQEDAGAVEVIYGHSTGLRLNTADFFTQGTRTDDVADKAEANDNFGAALVAGDYDDDQVFDLGIGVPEENIREANAGAVNVIYGDEGNGIDPTTTPTDQFWHQDRPDIDDENESGDQFGSSLG